MTKGATRRKAEAQRPNETGDDHVKSELGKYEVLPAPARQQTSLRPPAAARGILVRMISIKVPTGAPKEGYYFGTWTART